MDRHMGSRNRTWFVLADSARLRILQATGAPDGFEDILHRDGTAANPAAGRRRSVRSPPPARRFEACAARILNHAAALGLFDALVLAGPPCSLHQLTQDLNSPASGRLVAVVPTDLGGLPDAVLLARLQALLNRPS